MKADRRDHTQAIISKIDRHSAQRADFHTSLCYWEVSWNGLENSRFPEICLCSCMHFVKVWPLLVTCILRSKQLLKYLPSSSRNTLPCFFHIGNRSLSKNTMFPGLNVQLSDRNTELNDTNIMTWEHRSIKDYCEARKHDVTPPGIRSMTAWTYRPPAFYLEDQQQDSVDFMQGTVVDWMGIL